MNKKEFEKSYAEIMWMFRYTYKEEWAPGHISDGKSRAWVKAFNNLVEQGYVKNHGQRPVA